MSILNTLNNVNDVKKLNINELKTLCSEIRNVIIETTNKNGGHLSSNLGTVEITVALAYVFDFNKDKLIFDVGHQSYAYKILTDRLNDFYSIRTKNGISGFPDSSESKYDAFTVGHAGTSLSASLGYCFSRDKLNQDYYVINLVGDASFFNGENLEAITCDDNKPKKLLVILNDNGMSINKNNNGLYKLVSKVTVKKRYNNFNNFLSKTIGRLYLGKFLRKFKRFIKRSLSLNTVSDSIGLKYVGVFDGHDLKSLIKLLADIKESQNPTLLQLKTIKGKGYKDAEENSLKYHGIGKNFEASSNYFSNQISSILNRLIDKENRIVAITAGMETGVGLTEFAKKYPNSIKDVGIAEECAVTLAGGMAISGCKPIVFIYSTFLQRAYDQILHDVCLQNLPVIFCIDRAGLVGNDGKTHQGVFDLSYLSHIPNITIFAPKDACELELCLLEALKLNSPVAIRYPNGKQVDLPCSKDVNNNVLKWHVLKRGNGATILAVGPRMLDLAFKVSKTHSVTIVNARTIKPLDVDLLNFIKNDKIITLEENVIIGGFGEQVAKYYADNNFNANIKILGVKDEFIPHGTIQEQLTRNELTVSKINSLLD